MSEKNQILASIFERTFGDRPFLIFSYFQRGGGGPKGLASYYKAETTFTFHFSILTLPNAFLNIKNRDLKSESGFRLAMQWLASPFN